MHRRADSSGSTLVRLLASLTDAKVAQSDQSFSDRLSDWLDWRSAMSLSAALRGVASPGTSGNHAVLERLPTRDRQACNQLRSEFLKAFGEDTRTGAEGTAVQFSTYRRRYFARQQAMENRIAPLRARVRAAVFSASAPLAQLASVDEVMEQSLSARERTLLSSVPVLLQLHFERLRSLHPQGSAESDEEMQDTGWLQIFTRDMLHVLTAELDMRLQPVEGLLDALDAS